MRVKIVPDARPNAKGEWIEVPGDVTLNSKWKDAYAAALPHVPAGHHIVQIEASTFSELATNGNKG